MRVSFSGAGLYGALDKNDRDIALATGLLECRIENNQRYPMFYLHIVDKVEKQDFLEEPGFHIEAVPENIPREKREEYNVYISHNNFLKLINSATDTELGCIETRSRFDRIAFTYWNKSD